MKTFFKTIVRMFKNNLGRFLAIFSITLVSLIVCAGLGTLPSTCENNYIRGISDQNISDVIVKSKNPLGFSRDFQTTIINNKDVEEFDTYYTFDLEILEKNARVYFLNFKETKINKFNLTKGEYPTQMFDCVVEEPNRNTIGFEINEVINIPIDRFNISFTVTGFVKSPLYSSTNVEPFLLDLEKNLDAIVYLDVSILPTYILDVLPKNECILKIKSAESQYLSKNYKNEVNKFVENFKTNYENFDENYAVLTLEENVGYALFKNYLNKVKIISVVFPIFFIIVTTLVVLTTMTKLIEDERQIIGCYTSLGITKKRIISKYTTFGLLSTFIGCGLGLVIGIYIIPLLVYPAFQQVFYMPPLIFNGDIILGIICCILIILSSLIISLVLITKDLKEEPNELLHYKAPKPGKKILLERITFFWKRLPFKHKSSLRNIFRQKKNFILTSLSIIGSTVLVFFGFGLLDVSGALVGDPLFGDVINSMELISSFIVIFSVILTIIITYNIANMNVMERERELATLKLLGYRDFECSMYTFREILFISVVNVIVGIPIAFFMFKYLLVWLEFGNISYVNWYSYIATILIVLVSTVIVNILLSPKIKRIDMNDSLKSVD